jgi:hypothetical protein
MDQRLKRVVCDWAIFHMYDDREGYPILSPSDPVLEDLAFRLSLADLTPAEVDFRAQGRWGRAPTRTAAPRRVRRKESA